MIANPIQIDSREYQCWHELGHAVACLHFGGDVEFVELLDSHETGLARARCAPSAASRPSVLSGGFAAELYLFRAGRLAPQLSEKEMVRILYWNATLDREKLLGRQLGPEEEIPIGVDQALQQLAYQNVFPLIKKYAQEIEALVAELLATKKVTGARIRDVLGIAASA